MKFTIPRIRTICTAVRIKLSLKAIFFKVELRIRQINGMTMPKPAITACSNRSKDMKTGLFTA